MNSISIFSVVFCFTLHTIRAVPVSFQIDEFIKQLMSSEKFDELTDVIADKAAQKIKDMDSKPTGQSLLNILREREAENDQKPYDKIRFERKATKQKESRFDDKQFTYYTNKYKDSRSDEELFRHDIKDNKEFKSVLKENTDRSDEIHEDNRERNKDSLEISNASFKIGKYNRLKNKNEEVINKENIERKKDNPLKHNNDYSRSREKQTISAEKSHRQWQRKQTQKSIQSSESDPDNKKPENNKNAPQLENISKIDTQTLLNSHINSKELELNFKHLKGEILKHNVNLEKVSDSHKHGHKDNPRAKEKREDKNDVKNMTNSKRKNINSREAFISYGSIEHEKHEQSAYHAPENKKKTQLLQINQSGDVNSVSEENITNKKFNDNNIKEKPIARIGRPTNDSGELNEPDEGIKNAKLFIDRVMDRVSMELKNPTYASKDVVKESNNHSFPLEKDEDVDLIPKHSEEGEGYHSDSIETPNHSKNSPSQRKIFREENGKQFTYQSSAEYAEYHENLANAPKPKYFNTY